MKPSALQVNRINGIHNWPRKNMDTRQGTTWQQGDPLNPGWLVLAWSLAGCILGPKGWSHLHWGKWPPTPGIRHERMRRRRTHGRSRIVCSACPPPSLLRLGSIRPATLPLMSPEDGGCALDMHLRQRLRGALPPVGPPPLGPLDQARPTVVIHNVGREDQLDRQAKPFSAAAMSCCAGWPCRWPGCARRRPGEDR